MMILVNTEIKKVPELRIGRTAATTTVTIAKGIVLEDKRFLNMVNRFISVTFFSENPSWPDY